MGVGVCVHARECEKTARERATARLLYSRRVYPLLSVHLREIESVRARDRERERVRVSGRENERHREKEGACVRNVD